MPAKTKIHGELEIKLRELCEKGYNPHHIASRLNWELQKDTVKFWAKKNGYKLSARTSSKVIEFSEQAKQDLLSGINRKTVQKKYKLSFNFVKKLCEELNLPIRGRVEAALDKVLTNEQATAKLPEGSGKVIGFNVKEKKYVIRAGDGFVYRKSSGKLYQGDPRGKNGTKLSLDSVKAQLDILGYDYLDSWTIKRKPIRAIHKKCGQIREARLKNFYFQGCAICGNRGISRAEIDLLEWIRQYWPSAQKLKLSERITKPKEIDIFIPELKLGIEYCGLYWHAETLDGEEPSANNKHYRKMLMANKEGIRLITIFENEWKDREEQVKGFLLSAMGKNPSKVSARDCEVIEIDELTAGEFLEKTHIQGAPGSYLLNLGLIKNGEILGIMNFGTHPRGSKKEGGAVYLNRLSFKIGVTVVGGSSKMFKVAKKRLKEMGYSRIVSWSDNRWSEGRIYKTLGFDFSSQKDKGRGLQDGSIWPDFQYVFNGKLYSRAGIGRLNVVNREDLPKIYDCGKKRWVMAIRDGDIFKQI